MKKYGLYFTLIFVLTVAIFAIDHIKDSYSLPSDNTSIIKTNNIDDFAKYSSPSEDTSFYTVDTSNGKVSNGSFEDLAKGEDFETVVQGADTLKEQKEEVIDYLVDSKLYAVKDETKSNKIDVIAIYSNKRVRVKTNKKIKNDYGAKNGIFYKDSYIFSYVTDEDTKYAYENFREEFGKDNVMLDLPVKASAARGWGTSFMKFEDQISSIGTSTNKVIVAVLDTGINKNHNVFNGHTILNGKNIVTGGTMYDDNGHGTAVSGIIAESTSAENVSILPIKVLDNVGTGSLLDILVGLDYANEQHAKVANMSFAVNLYKMNYARAFDGTSIYDTINNMEEQMKDFSLLMVSASGNESVNADIVYSYPSCSSNTISVGSINQNENISNFSNYGTTVDFVAPGGDITIAEYSGKNNYRIGSGTSFSAPYISAAAATVFTEYPDYSNLKAKNYLIKISKDLGTTGKDDKYGNGVPIFNQDQDFDDTYFIEKYNATLSNDSFTYDGRNKNVTVTLKDNNETILNSNNYTIKTFNNKNAGKALVTITGKNNYYGTIIKTFTIKEASLNGGHIKLSTNTFTYDGKRKTPLITVFDKNNNLVNSSEYDLKYENSINAGTGIVKVTGKNNYTGTLNTSFTIKKATLSSATIALSGDKYTYTGNEIKPTISVKTSGGVVVNNTNYDTIYSNNKKIGTATVKITGKGNYTGTVYKTFNIIPKKPVMKKIVRYKSKFKITAKKTNDSPNGYQVKYKKTTAKKWKYKTFSKRTFTIKKLKKNKNYYIKIRSFKKVNNTKYYSSWSTKYKFKTLR